MAKITLSMNSHGRGYLGFLVTHEDGRDILIQRDWEYPGVASTFGWVPCKCGATDGTVDCKPCGRHVSAMLSEAEDYLVEHEGEEADDPGYFPEVDEWPEGEAEDREEDPVEDDDSDNDWVFSLGEDDDATPAES